MTLVEAPKPCRPEALLSLPSNAEATWGPVVQVMPRVINCLPQSVRNSLGLNIQATYPSPDPVWQHETDIALARMIKNGQPPPVGANDATIHSWLMVLTVGAIAAGPPEVKPQSVADATTILAVTPPRVAPVLWWCIFRERPALLAAGLPQGAPLVAIVPPGDGPELDPGDPPEDKFRLLGHECARAGVGLPAYLKALYARYLNQQRTLWTPAEFGLERALAAE